MLHTIFPISIEYSTIKPKINVVSYNAFLKIDKYLPGKNTMALFLVERKSSFISTTIAVDEKSFSMHLVVFEVANVVTTVRP